LSGQDFRLSESLYTKGVYKELCAIFSEHLGKNGNGGIRAAVKKTTSAKRKNYERRLKWQRNFIANGVGLRIQVYQV
jgi:hypothetical protein